jgi:hypothetical protein
MGCGYVNGLVVSSAGLVMGWHLMEAWVGVISGSEAGRRPLEGAGRDRPQALHSARARWGVCAVLALLWVSALAVGSGFVLMY